MSDEWTHTLAHTCSYKDDTKESVVSMNFSRATELNRETNAKRGCECAPKHMHTTMPIRIWAVTGI